MRKLTIALLAAASFAAAPMPVSAGETPGGSTATSPAACHAEPSATYSVVAATPLCAGATQSSVAAAAAVSCPTGGKTPIGPSDEMAAWLNLLRGLLG